LIPVTRAGIERAGRLARALGDASILVAKTRASILAPNVEGTELQTGARISTYRGAFRDEIAQVMRTFDQRCFVLSVGAAVRLIAPHLVSKQADPGGGRDRRARTAERLTKPSLLPKVARAVFLSTRLRRSAGAISLRWGRD
jgi:hypothetical protein